MRSETRRLFDQWKLLRLAVDQVESQIMESCKERADRNRQEYGNSRYRRELFRLLIETQPYRCAHCHTTDGELTIDHIMPISMGGRNTLSNLQFLCPDCNVKKANDLAEHWRWLRRKAGWQNPKNIPDVVQVVIDAAARHAAELEGGDGVL